MEEVINMPQFCRSFCYLKGHSTLTSSYLHSRLCKNSRSGLMTGALPFLILLSMNIRKVERKNIIKEELPEKEKNYEEIINIKRNFNVKINVFNIEIVRQILKLSAH